ncbi:MAG: FkbM family methyltransferase [Aquisalimonadaceae bacterium]
MTTPTRPSTPVQGRSRLAGLRRTLGILRSVMIYWRPGRQGPLRQLYRQFVGKDDLVFDVGAHLGDRTAAFASLGARVVALEPQPEMHAWLNRLVGGKPGVTILAEAVGAEAGTADLAISRATPTVSTLSADWRRTIGDRNPGFRRVQWEDTVSVPVTTLDRLIDQYGVPAFCKIDVEGYEAQVLAGLSRAIPALSVEFVPGAMDVAIACVDRLSELGPYEFNVIYGEQRQFTLAQWKSAEGIKSWLSSVAGSASSGDIYARLPR